MKTNPEPSFGLYMVHSLSDANQFNVTIDYVIVGQPLVETVSFVLKRPE